MMEFHKDGTYIRAQNVYHTEDSDELYILTKTSMITNALKKLGAERTKNN